MRNLPTNRIKYLRPFTNTGVDYCWLFKLYHRRGREIYIVKSYVPVFICFVTKATRLELISDLCIAKFLGALKRFMVRRGNVLMYTGIMQLILQVQETSR